MSDDLEDTAPRKKKKKGGIVKLLLLSVGTLVLLGGGAGGALYAAQSGWFGNGMKSTADNMPHLVPKSEQKRATTEGEAKSGPMPGSSGGEKYASTYYALDKEFTSNLQNSVHFIQVSVAVSTSYDDRVIDNLKTHEIAVRSAILMTLGESTEDQVFTVEGKRLLQKHLADAINQVLKEKEGFGGIGNVYFTSFIVQ